MQEKSANNDQPQPFGWDDISQVSKVSIQIGYGLIPMVQDTGDNELSPHIQGVRKRLSLECGFLLPAITISDTLDLATNSYQVTFMGAVQGEFEICPDRKLAIDPVLITYVTDSVPSNSMAKALGIFNFFGMTSSVIAPTLTGYIGDITGSKVLAFYIAAILLAAAAILFFLVVMLKEKKATHPLTNE